MRTKNHVKMMPWALVFVVIYSLAFPLFIYCKFSKNKLKIFEDQLLMAQDRGDKPETNVTEDINISPMERSGGTRQEDAPDPRKIDQRCRHAGPAVQDRRQLGWAEHPEYVDDSMDG